MSLLLRSFGTHIHLYIFIVKCLEEIGIVYPSVSLFDLIFMLFCCQRCCFHAPFFIIGCCIWKMQTDEGGPMLQFFSFCASSVYHITFFFSFLFFSAPSWQVFEVF